MIGYCLYIYISKQYKNLVNIIFVIYYNYYLGTYTTKKKKELFKPDQINEF